MTSDASPISPPILLPDVPGADADARGLPDRAALSAPQRLIVDASAASDIWLRTAVASMVSVAMIPSVMATVASRDEPRRERDHLRFYAELATEQDPAKSFPAPTAPEDLVAAGESARRTHRRRGRREHRVHQQLRSRQPGHAQLLA